MKLILLTLMLATVLLVQDVLAQSISAPVAQSVYGGRVNAITGYRISTDSSRIFVATESANSVFYADMYVPAGSPASSYFEDFQVMAGLDGFANYGANIRNICAHANSGCLIFSHENLLLSSYPTSTNVDTIYSGSSTWALVKNDSLFFITQGGSGKELHFGTLDNTANFTESSGSPVAFLYSGFDMQFVMGISNVNNRLYVFVRGSDGVSPMLYKSSDNFGSFDSSTTFSDISPAFSTGYQYEGFGIAPDGTLFIGSSNGMNKFIATSADEITWNEFDTGLGGAPANNIVFGGTAPSYYVYYSTIYSDSKGIAGSWHSFGESGQETHPNDGDVFVDPGDSSVVYLTTDQGIGASVNRGDIIFEINDGMLAIQINDFDMSDDFTNGYAASKSGIRKVEDFTTSPVWTDANFPNGDGSPYSAVDMVGLNSTKLYVGNVRVYKSVDDMNSWTQVFTAENAPYNYDGVGTHVECIEVCEYDTSIVFAGYIWQDSLKGGLFYSHDSGNTWDQILLDATSGYQDVDVWDVIFTLEGSDTIAYVGVEYDLEHPTGRSVYKLTKSGSTWSVQQDMNSSTTSTGSLIVASIFDLHKSSTGDTIFACGTDAGVNHPVAYYKPVSTTGMWTPFTTSGFPMIAENEGKAITFGNDTVYCAVDNDLYTYKFGDSKWSLGYSYPNGTKINVLYFDDLLVGTSIGLYGHQSQGGAVTTHEIARENIANFVTYWQLLTNQLTVESKSIKGSFDIKVMDLSGRTIIVKRNCNISNEKSYSFNLNVQRSQILLVQISGENINELYKVPLK